MLATKPLAIVAISVIALIGFLVLQPLHPSTGGINRALPVDSCNRPPGYIVFTLDSTGLNHSIRLGPPNVVFQRGETVNLLICNLDAVQSHGFAVEHYFDIGVTLRPGDFYKVAFVVRDPGSFTIYCNVFCTVHVHMQAKLIVK